MTKRLYESGGSKPTPLGSGIFESCILRSGWGSSGFYSPELLKEYGPSVFHAGRPSFANHPTEAEFNNGRDITKIMGRLVTDAEFREDDNGASLWANIKVNKDWSEFVEDFKDTIGLSIFASGSVQEDVEMDGRTGTIIESLDADDPYTSVDFVVAAGAGGKVERMLESFRAHEALKTDREEQLRNLVRDAYSEDRVYAWVRDFDDDLNLVYFDVDGSGDAGIFRQSYSVSDDIAIELVGEREEVRVETTYVPINVRQTTESAPADIDKENGMTPEDIKAVVEAVKEALAPIPPVDEGTAGPTVAEVAEAVATSGLPESARKRVYAAIEAGTEVGVAIEAEKALIEEVKESLKTDDDEGDPGYIREAAGTSGTSTRVNIPGWSN